MSALNVRSLSLRRISFISVRRFGSASTYSAAAARSSASLDRLLAVAREPDRPPACASGQQFLHQRVAVPRAVSSGSRWRSTGDSDTVSCQRLKM